LLHIVYIHEPMDENLVEGRPVDVVKYVESFELDPNVFLNKRVETFHLLALLKDIVPQMAKEAVIDSLLMEWN